MIDDVVDMTKAGVRPTGAPEVLVLLSGGIDSAGCLAFYVDMGRPVTAMFVDYGQLASNQEHMVALVEMGTDARVE